MSEHVSQFSDAFAPQGCKCGHRWSMCNQVVAAQWCGTPMPNPPGSVVLTPAQVEQVREWRNEADRDRFARISPVSRPYHEGELFALARVLALLDAEEKR